jgi:hypothetical protein
MKVQELLATPGYGDARSIMSGKLVKLPGEVKAAG